MAIRGERAGSFPVGFRPWSPTRKPWSASSGARRCPSGGWPRAARRPSDRRRAACDDAVRRPVSDHLLADLPRTGRRDRPPRVGRRRRRAGAAPGRRARSTAAAFATGRARQIAMRPDGAPLGIGGTRARSAPSSACTPTPRFALGAGGYEIGDEIVAAAGGIPDPVLHGGAA